MYSSPAVLAINPPSLARLDDAFVNRSIMVSHHVENEEEMARTSYTSVDTLRIKEFSLL
jgi:hypothetical protein